MKKIKIKVEKIGSVLKNIPLPPMVILVPKMKAVEGEVIVLEVLSVPGNYDKLELTSGEMAKIKKGDIIAGALGQRKALEGIVGFVPKTIRCGDVLNILNLGGVVGHAVSWNKDYVYFPAKAKVLGAIAIGGQPVNIQNFSLKPQKNLKIKTPIIAVAGTGMAAGKTTVVYKLIEFLVKQKGLKVAAAKLTGVATQRDILAMKKMEATEVLSFLDAGLTSTIGNPGKVISSAKAILNTLDKKHPDVIVVELGDGILGWYGVDKLLNDEQFIKAVKFTVVCAHDLVGAVGAYEILKKKGIKIDFFAGPVTNNSAGIDYLEQILKIPSADIRDDKEKILKALIEKLAFAKALASKGVLKHD